jgi:hypothetical protein
MAHQHDDEKAAHPDQQREAIVTSDPRKPRIDWFGQIRYFALIIVAVVAVLMLMRYLGLRG